MELKVKSESIKVKRQARAWSQEQLSHVSGLGVRTIQRIESTGSASYESIGAIASALEVPTSILVDQSVPAKLAQNWPTTFRQKIAILVTSALASISLIYLSTATADQINLDVGVSLNDVKTSEAATTTDEGENAIVQFGDGYRLTISPSVEGNGDIALSVLLSRLVGDEYVRIAQPRIVTPDGEIATITSKDKSGDILIIGITPTLN